MADYFSQTDLENALGEQVVSAIYDDDHDGSADSAPIAACIAYGGAQCDSYLRGVYYGTDSSAITLPLTTVPNEVKFAALDFGIAYSLRRRPDVVQAMNGMAWKEHFDLAVEQMKRYCAAEQRLPTTTGTPATVGLDNFPPDPDDDDDVEPKWSSFGDFS